MDRGGCVYILTNKAHKVLYTGVTSDLYTRIVEHKENHFPGSFTSKYHCYKLVYFEQHCSIIEAIAREKQIKNWKREWKINVITVMNPQWDDLFYTIEL